jgi:YesN/AraC family two-component response regulator
MELKQNLKAKKTILFVDDEPQEIKYFNKAFSKDFDILSANSVDQAIEIIKENHEKIGVVITDQRMPGKTGLDLLDYVYSHHADIVRILTTAYCDTKNAIDAINNAQVFRYIAKPWDIESLHQSLDQALKQCLLQARYNEEQILSSLDEDCHHWQGYSMYAHGDEFVYRSGLEAIALQHNQRVDKHIEANAGHKIKEKINSIIIDKYTSNKALKKMQKSQILKH